MQQTGKRTPLGFGATILVSIAAFALLGSPAIPSIAGGPDPADRGAATREPNSDPLADPEATRTEPDRALDPGREDALDGELDVAEANDGAPPPEADAGGEPELVEPDGAADARAADGAFVVGPFSEANGQLPSGWEPLLFENIPAHTRYTVERDDSGADPSNAAWVVRAESAGSASGLIRKVDVDLAEYPILQWRWKVGGVLAKGDVTQKSGDDYPARIYIAFAYVPDRVPFFRRVQYRAGRALFGDIPIGAINYIWASNATRGAIVDNPYAGDFVKMIVVESGDGLAGRWQVEERNVLEDYRAAFGEDPPPVEGVAIMTDTDNTGERATSWYGDIRFVRADPRP